jgi:hypothetical protein
VVAHAAAMVHASVRKLHSALSSRMQAPLVQSLPAPCAGDVGLFPPLRSGLQPNVVITDVVGRNGKTHLYSGEKIRHHDFYAGFAGTVGRSAILRPAIGAPRRNRTTFHMS